MLYRRAKIGMPLRRVLGNANDKKEVLRQLHVELGPQGRDGSHEKARLRFNWEGLYRHINRYIRSARSLRNVGHTAMINPCIQRSR